MKVTAYQNLKSSTRTDYDDGSVIHDFFTMKIYSNKRTNLRVEYQHRIFTMEVSSGERTTIPDMTNCNEAEHFQLSLLYDIDVLLPIQIELKS